MAKQAFTVRLDEDLHRKVTEKAERELRPLNAVIGRLLEKWLAGEVNLEPPEQKEESEQT